MKTNKKLLLAYVVAVAAVAAACSSNNKPGPGSDGSTDDGVTVIGGSSNTGGTVNGSGGNGNGSGSAGSGGGSGGTAPKPPRADCPDTPNNTKDGCWDLSECNGASEVQFLQQCTKSTCFPFDNNGRIPGYTGDDSLPPL